jgi:hypothetical protein
VPNIVERRLTLVSDPYNANYKPDRPNSDITHFSTLPGGLSPN